LKTPKKSAIGTTNRLKLNPLSGADLRLEVGGRDGDPITVKN
jgi:hypothetical protein